MKQELGQLNPTTTPEQFLSGFVPPQRFANTHFDNYYPNPEYHSQTFTRDSLSQFIQQPPKPRRSFFALAHKAPEGVGYYLDGGFGVGKTHLLAAAWYGFGGQKAFLSHQELLYTIGVLGMNKAVAAFKSYALICLDEFELDDPGNTHMTATFLSQLMPSGTHVITTSNTEPSALGQGRFNADDFKYQIQSIANRFTVLSVDGPDYRGRGLQLSGVLTPAGLDVLEQRSTGEYLRSSHNELQAHLLKVHPARFSPMLAGIGSVFVDDLQTLPDQNSALRFVHLIDKIYDLNIEFACSGVELDALFPATYRYGAFQKKYSRALSRLTEMLGQARTKCHSSIAAHT